MRGGVERNLLQRFVTPLQSGLGRLNGADKCVEVCEGLRHISQKRTRVGGETNFKQGLRRGSRAVEMQELVPLLKIGVDRSLISSGALKIGSAALRIGLNQRPFRSVSSTRRTSALSSRPVYLLSSSNFSGVSASRSR